MRPHFLRNFYISKNKTNNFLNCGKIQVLFIYFILNYRKYRRKEINPQLVGVDDV